MSNSYYNHGSYPTTGAPGASSALRAELDLITVGFALLPTLSGNANKALVINAGGSAVTVTTGTLALAGNFATTGAFNTTLVQGATTSLTLPVVSGTLATLAGTETLSNKTLVAPALGTPASGIMTNVTGTAAGLTAGNVTTNANLTGDVTSVGNATSIAAGVIVNADINASAAIDDTKLATIATALKVSNSATTAASANTASAIVSRDASGDFSAGTVTAALTGNASTATALATGRTIAITGDLAYTSPSFDGTGNVTAAGTLATVATAGTTGSSTAIPVITINVKGLTTSITTAVVVAPAGTLTGSTLASGVTASSLTSLGTIASLAVTAGTISTTPSAATDIANKSYVDTIAQGLDTKASVVAGTTANISLTGAQTIDGVSVVATDRVLVKNQTAPAENGIYVASATAWARASDMSTWAQVPGAYVFVETGTTLADTGWVCTSDAGGTLNTTAITWAQFSGAGSGVSSITFGTTGLTPSTTTTGAVTVAGTLAVANGGTGVTTSTGTTNVVLSNSPTLVTPALGSPSSVGTMPAFTLGGTVSGGGNQINNVIIGTTTPLAGSFTTLSASGQITASATGGGVTFASTGGQNIRVYGGSASHQWDIYGNGTNLRFSDNTGGGKVVIDTALDSGALAVTGTLSSTLGATIQGLTVGLGAGAVATNTAVGVSALQANTVGASNTAVGYQAGYTNTTGTHNFYGGYVAGKFATGSDNTFVGVAAGYVATSSYNTMVGSGAGQSVISGANNTLIGINAGTNITSGGKNTVIGGYNGNQGGLDIRTASNYIVLSDGDGNPLIATYPGASVSLNGAVPQTGTGITFPATQLASSNANTLDDYEEDTWAPTDNSGASLTFTSVFASYTKIGRAVTINVELTFPTTANTTAVAISLPVSSDSSTRGGGAIFSNRTGGTNIYFPGGANFVLYDDTGTAITNATMSTKYIIFSLTYFTA